MHIFELNSWNLATPQIDLRIHKESGDSQRERGAVSVCLLHIVKDGNPSWTMFELCVFQCELICKETRSVCKFQYNTEFVIGLFPIKVCLIIIELDSSVGKGTLSKFCFRDILSSGT